MLDPRVRAELAAVVGEGALLDTAEDLTCYGYDATPRFAGAPDAVLLPSSAEQVAAILRIALRERLPVVPRGSGTSLSGGAVPLAGGLVVSTARLDRILEIDTANLTATVQPGVVTAHLHAAVEGRGLFYPPDPASMRVSTIGGNVNENSGGLRGLKYGVTRDYVLGLEAVLMGGDVIRTGGKCVKDVAGYDLTRLLVGSEGTLAFVTEVTVRLLPLPRARRTMLALYADMAQAARTVAAVIAARITPATLEFLDRGTIRCVEEYTGAGLPLDADALLLIEADGDGATVAAEAEEVAALCRREGATELRLARDAAEAERLVAARRGALAALSRVRPTTILEDVTVPRSRIPDMLAAIRGAAGRHGVTIYTFGHAGDGNLHPTCLCDLRDAAEMERVEAAYDEIFARALELDGTITGEHGVGASKKGYLPWQYSESAIGLMRRIKHAFDPEGLLNPGKVFGGEPRRRLTVDGPVGGVSA